MQLIHILHIHVFTCIHIYVLTVPLNRFYLDLQRSISGLLLIIINSTNSAQDFSLCLYRMQKKILTGQTYPPQPKMFLRLWVVVDVALFHVSKALAHVKQEALVDVVIQVTECHLFR